MTDRQPDVPLVASRLSAEAFRPFGEVIDARGQPSMMINRGRCGRFHDQADIDIDGSGRAAISLFQAEAYSLPHTLDLLERHPLGSQAFLPMTADPFLVIVAPDEDGSPGEPLAFVTEPGQGVNYRRNTWHGVLTPFVCRSLFAVVDYVGTEPNLEEHALATPIVIEVPVELIPMSQLAHA